MTMIEHHTPTRRAHVSVKNTPRPPCAERPDDWDLDTGNPETWRHAVATCNDCPLLRQCAQLAATLTDRGHTPRAMIWAGVGYDNAGNVIGDLSRHRTTPVDRRPPTIIIRTAPSFREHITEHRTTQCEATPAVPRRQIVIRRGIRRVPHH